MSIKSAVDWQRKNPERHNAHVRAYRIRNLQWKTYEHVDADGVVIYVGKTNFLPNRKKLHRLKSSWFGDIARVMTQDWPNEAAATMAEAWLIAIHKPRYNLVGMR